MCCECDSGRIPCRFFCLFLVPFFFWSFSSVLFFPAICALWGCCVVLFVAKRMKRTMNMPATIASPFDVSGRHCGAACVLAFAKITLCSRVMNPEKKKGVRKSYFFLRFARSEMKLKCGRDRRHYPMNSATFVDALFRRTHKRTNTEKPKGTTSSNTFEIN